MDVNLYLDRIGFKGNVEPSLQVLANLQKRHLLTVPFENLDIHYGIPIKLDTALFFDKIVINKRGGFCYELNGLFFYQGLGRRKPGLAISRACVIFGKFFDRNDKWK